MKLYTTTDASRPSSIFLTTTYTQPYTKLTEEEKQFSSSSLGAHQKKKDVIKWKFARCQFLVRLIILELRRKLLLEKKRKDFHAKRHTFFEERARASEYT